MNSMIEKLAEKVVDDVIDSAGKLLTSVCGALDAYAARQQAEADSESYYLTQAKRDDMEKEAKVRC